MSLLTEMNYNDSRFSELGKNRNMDIHLLNQIRGAVWKFDENVKTCCCLQLDQYVHKNNFSYK